MVVVQVSEAQARKLGIDVPKTRPKRDRRTARGPYHTRCHTCLDEFTTQASETRHNAEAGHCRFDLVLGTGDS